MHYFTDHILADCVIETKYIRDFFAVLGFATQLFSNSVLCEALGDRISGDSSGINFFANSSDSTCLKLGKKASCTIFLLFYIIRVYISSRGG